MNSEIEEVKKSLEAMGIDPDLLASMALLELLELLEKKAREER